MKFELSLNCFTSSKFILNRGVFKTLLNVYDGAFTEIDNDQKLLSSQKTPY